MIFSCWSQNSEQGNDNNFEDVCFPKNLKMIDELHCLILLDTIRGALSLEAWGSNGTRQFDNLHWNTSQIRLGMYKIIWVGENLKVVMSGRARNGHLGNSFHTICLFFFSSSLSCFPFGFDTEVPSREKGGSKTSPLPPFLSLHLYAALWKRPWQICSDIERFLMPSYDLFFFCLRWFTKRQRILTLPLPLTPCIPGVQ